VRRIWGPNLANQCSSCYQNFLLFQTEVKHLINSAAKCEHLWIWNWNKTAKFHNQEAPKLNSHCCENKKFCIAIWWNSEICVYVHTYVPTYLHTYIHMYIPAYVYVCVCVCVCVYIHIHGYVHMCIHNIVLGWTNTVHQVA